MGQVFEFSDILLWGLLTALFYCLFIHKSRRDKLLKAFPGPPRPPIIGHILDFLLTKREDHLPIMLKWCEKYGPIVKTFAGSQSFLMINDPKYIEKIVNSNAHMTKGKIYDLMRPWLGDGILLSEGQKWSHRRKMLTPAFHFKILEDFLPIMDKESRKMVNILRDGHGDGGSFDVGPYITRCTLDIICETAMGTSLNAQDGENAEYSRAIRGFGEIMQSRAIRPWLHNDWMWKRSSYYKEEQEVLKILHGFTDNVIMEKKKAREIRAKESNLSNVVPDPEEDNLYFGRTKKKTAFLDLLLDVQEELGEQEFTDQNIREETDTFMFGGHDTTSVAATYALFALGSYPEIQRKAREELDYIFGEEKERPVTSEDITKMKYLDCVIKESLRLYPSVPFIQRQLNSDLKIDSRTIPGDVTLTLFIYGVHRNPEYHPEPEIFRPERFLEGNKMTHTYAFIPFSAGARNCIGQKFAGMEEKVVIANVLRNFEISSAKDPKELPLLAEITLRSPGGVHIKLTPR